MAPRPTCSCELPRKLSPPPSPSPPPPLPPPSPSPPPPLPPPSPSPPPPLPPPSPSPPPRKSSFHSRWRPEELVHASYIVACRTSLCYPPPARSFTPSYAAHSPCMHTQLGMTRWRLMLSRVAVARWPAPTAASSQYKMPCMVGASAGDSAELPRATGKPHDWRTQALRNPAVMPHWFGLACADPAAVVCQTTSLWLRPCLALQFGAPMVQRQAKVYPSSHQCLLW